MSTSSKSSTGRSPGRPAGKSAPVTKAKLLKRAREVFAASGYDGASTYDIVTQAGVNISVLYYHFENKAGIYLAAMTEIYDSLLAAYEDAIVGKETPAERLDAVIAVQTPFVLADPSLASFLVSANLDVRRHPDLKPAMSLLHRSNALFAKVVTGNDGAEASPGMIGVCNVLMGGLAAVASFGHKPEEYTAIVATLRNVINAAAVDELSRPSGS